MSDPTRGDDALSIRSPIVLRPTLMTRFGNRPLPPPWPGGMPRFPIDANFYLAALRAELAWLIHSGTRFQDLISADGDSPPDASSVHALAFSVWSRARGFFHHTGRLTQFMRCGLHELGSRLRVVGTPEAFTSLSTVHAMVDPTMFKHSSREDYARYISTPARLAGLMALYDHLPPFEFDFSILAEPSVVASGRPEAAPAKAKRKRGRPSDTNHNEDRRIFDLWENGGYSTYAELAVKERKTERDVELAIGRHKRREKRRAGQNPG